MTTNAKGMKPSERIHEITLELLNKNPEYVNDKDLYLHIRITGLIKYLDEVAEKHRREGKDER